MNQTTEASTSKQQSQGQAHGSPLPEYQALVRRLQAMGNGIHEEPKCIGLTSSTDGEGVSTVAIQLARASAGMTGKDILLIDSSEDNGLIARTFGTRSKPGLAELLAGQGEILDLIVPAGEKLWVLPRGSSKLMFENDLGPAGVSNLLDVLKDRFHLTIVDLAPARETSECMALASALDGILLVVQSEAVTPEQLTKSKLLLEQANAHLVGAILNQKREYVPRLLRQR